MKELKDYQNLILDWAKDKNITTEDCIPMQKLKLIEEVGELAKAILKKDIEQQKDGVGDIFVVLTILAEQNKEEFALDFIMLNFSNDSLSDLLSTIIYDEYTVGFETILEVCKRLDLNILDCVEFAWNEIKDRKGKTINGTFIKN